MPADFLPNPVLLGQLVVNDPLKLSLGASPEFDASRCAREPIHIPGAVQPHGALVAAREDGLLVSHASANLAVILGKPAEGVLGRPLQEAIGEAACHALQS